MSNKKRITVGDVIGLFYHGTCVEISTSKATLMTININEKYVAGDYLSDELLNSEIDSMFINNFEEDFIAIQIKDDEVKECL